MRNFLRPLLALSIASVFGASAMAATNFSGFGNDSFGTMLSYDSFNLSIHKRMEAVRYQPAGSGYTRGSYSNDSYSQTPLFSSDEAYALAPSSRSGSVSSSRRRQLDCVYSSGFTVWGDMYQTWATQRSRGAADGYKFRTTGPAVGFDWTNGPLTLGAATTYNFGRMKAKDYRHDRKLRTWATTIYGQYNIDLFYINATLGYGHNRFRSRRSTDLGTANDSYKTNAWNVDTEVGYKMNFSGMFVTPHVGLRYYRDRRGTVNESGLRNLRLGTRNHNVWELPIAVDVGYEIVTGGSVIVPRAKFGWTPQLNEKRGRSSGVESGNIPYVENAARRSRHGFIAGLGVEAKITKSLSAHIDYEANFRSKAHEHHWNLGVGLTF